jgi:hypothetical protein
VLRRWTWRLRNGFWRRWYGWTGAGRILFVVAMALSAGAVAAAVVPLL